MLMAFTVGSKWVKIQSPILTCINLKYCERGKGLTCIQALIKGYRGQWKMGRTTEHRFKTATSVLSLPDMGVCNTWTKTALSGIL